MKYMREIFEDKVRTPDLGEIGSVTAIPVGGLRAVRYLDMRNLASDAPEWVDG